MSVSHLNSPSWHSLWNSLYLARKVSLSERIMLAPRWSNRSVDSKDPDSTYSFSSWSARNVANVESYNTKTIKIANALIVDSRFEKGMKPT